MRIDDAIGELNRALQAWRDELRNDANLRRIGEIALVTFGAGGVKTIDPAGGRDQVAEPFVPIDQFNPPPLHAAGYSPMVTAIKRATAIVDSRRRTLNRSGIQMAYRPLVYLLTDGAPSDENGRPCGLWRHLAPELRRQEDQQDLRFFAFGVRGADPEVLRELAPQTYYQVNGTDFTQVLGAVRQSIERVMKGDGAQPDLIRKSVEARRTVHDWILKQQQG
jgi:uncharacterized protein YegL